MGNVIAAYSAAAQVPIGRTKGVLGMNKVEAAQLIRLMISNIIQNPSQFNFRIEIDSGTQESNTGGVGIVSNPTITAPVDNVIGLQSKRGSPSLDIGAAEDYGIEEVSKQLAEALSVMASIADELEKGAPDPTLLQQLGDSLRKHTLPTVVSTAVIFIINQCVGIRGPSVIMSLNKKTL